MKRSPVPTTGRLRLDASKPVKVLLTMFVLVAVMGASCSEEIPGAEEVSATVHDCTNTDVDAASGVENCVISSDDPRLQGIWTFAYIANPREDGASRTGGLLIETSDGRWEGTADWTVLDSGPWKGGANLRGTGAFEGYELDIGVEQDSRGVEFPISGHIYPEQE